MLTVQLGPFGMCTHTCTCYILRQMSISQRKNCDRQFSTSIMYVLGIELKSSELAESSIPTKPSSEPETYFYIDCDCNILVKESTGLAHLNRAIKLLSCCKTIIQNSCWIMHIVTSFSQCLQMKKPEATTVITRVEGRASGKLTSVLNRLLWWVVCLYHTTVPLP